MNIAELSRIHEAFGENYGASLGNAISSKQNEIIFAMDILQSEYDLPSNFVFTVDLLLTMMGNMLLESKDYLNRIIDCRQKDSIRGRRIIPDYLIVHGLVDSDSGVGLEVNQELNEVQYDTVDPVLLGSIAADQQLTHRIQMVTSVLTSH